MQPCHAASSQTYMDDRVWAARLNYTGVMEITMNELILWKVNLKCSSVDARDLHISLKNQIYTRQIEVLSQQFHVTLIFL